MSRGEIYDQAICMWAICQRPGNPVAWVKLERAGLTLEGIRAAAENGNWVGAKPDYASYPDPEFKALIEASLDAKEPTT